MNHKVEDGGMNFGHEFHGREHHFLLTREALEHLAGRKNLTEVESINAYNTHLQKIHAVAERLSRTTDSLERIVLERSAFD
jgi:hypothetical protein